MRSTKILHITIASANLFFLLLFISASFSNRLSIDDFHFLHNIRQNNIFNATHIEYQQWSTRYSSVLLNHSVQLLQTKWKYTLFCFNIIGLLVFIVALQMLLKNILMLLHCKHWSFLARFNTALFAVSALFLTTIKIDETWFWLCASCTYLWSIVFLALGAAWITHFNLSKKMGAIGAISLIYVGGACEPLAVVTIVVLSALLVFEFFRQKPANMLLRQRLATAIALCLCAFILLYIGPGNKVREQFFLKTSLYHSFILNFQMTDIVIEQFFKNKIPLIIAFAAPMMYAGACNKSNKTDDYWVLKILLIFTLCYCAIFLHQWTMTYKIQNVGAFRALFALSLYTIVACALIFYLIGKNFEMHRPALHFATVCCAIIAASFLAQRYFNEKESLQNYASAYDSRMNFLLQHKNDSSALVVKALPPSSLLYSAEIREDSTHFSNLHLRMGLQLKCSSLQRKQ